MRQGRGKRGGRGKRRVQLGDDTERACANPNVDYARLLNGTDHRHTCERVRRACLFNGTIVSAEPGSADAAHAAAVSRRLRVRDMWESGQEHPLSDYHSLHHPTNPLGATLVADVARGGGFSACVPLVWLPAWLMNFGESLIASLLPIDELQEAHLIDGRVLLTPELWHCGMPSVPLPAAAHAATRRLRSPTACSGPRPDPREAPSPLGCQRDAAAALCGGALPRWPNPRSRSTSPAEPGAPRSATQALPRRPFPDLEDDRQACRPNAPGDKAAWPHGARGQVHRRSGAAGAYRARTMHAPCTHHACSMHVACMANALQHPARLERRRTRTQPRPLRRVLPPRPLLPCCHCCHRCRITNLPTASPPLPPVLPPTPLPLRTRRSAAARCSATRRF